MLCKVVNNIPGQDKMKNGCFEFEWQNNNLNQNGSNWEKFT